jgi:Phosphotransferase enzyme family
MSLYDRTKSSALTARAVAGSISVASNYGINVDNPRVLADAYSVRVYLYPAPIVARVSTITSLLRSPIDDWLAREISVAQFLASQGAPVVAPSDILPAQPHHCDGLVMTFWRYVQPICDTVPESVVVGEMLAQLHAILRDYPGELPLLAPPLNDIPRGLERLERAGNILAVSDLTLLKETFNRLLPQLTNPTNVLQPLHGDANPFNLIHTADGLLWNDFEDTCRGSIEWDLINLDDEARAAYPNAPDSATLDLYRQARQLHAIVWVYALLPEFPNWLEYVKVMLDELRDRA